MGRARHRRQRLRYNWLPKLDGRNRSHIAIFEAMNRGEIQGMFVWGQNPAVGGPQAELERKALENLDWMVAVDIFETETASFWRRPDVNPADIKTEVFLLPAAASYEKTAPSQCAAGSNGGTRPSIRLETPCPTSG